MKKVKLYGIGNEGNFNYYEFDKNKEVHKILRGIFLKEFDIDWPLKRERFGDNDKKEIMKVDILKNKDMHETMSKEGVRIDIFYGDKKMFLTIHCSPELRLKFNEGLFNIAIMLKPKKFKPLEK